MKGQFVRLESVQPCCGIIAKVARMPHSVMLGVLVLLEVARFGCDKTTLIALEFGFLEVTRVWKPSNSFF